MKISDRHDAFIHRYAFVLSDDPARLDMDWVVDFLATTDWSKSIAKVLRQQALAGSHCYGLYALDGSPAGFVRVISDGAMFGWIGDFFIVHEYRGRGPGRWILAILLYSSRFDASGTGSSPQRTSKPSIGALASKFLRATVNS